MQISAEGAKMRRYLRSQKAREQNSIYETSPSKFYRQIKNDKINVEKVPAEEEVKSFWQGIWGDDTPHNSENEWKARLEEKWSHVPVQQWRSITTEQHDES